MFGKGPDIEESERAKMNSIMLKAKLHQARVTESDLNYEGSMAIDQDLLDAVGIACYEKILVANLENGNRFETYAIPARRGSGTIGLNGATVFQGGVGDRVIIFTFCSIPTGDIPNHHPKVLILNEKNQPVGPVRELSTM